MRTRGFHPEDRVWYDPQGGLENLDVPDNPTPADIAAARSLLLDDLAVDFPFASESDRAHFLAALLLPFARRMIPGCTPLHVFEAPAVGSGKSLLCATIATVTTGGDGTTSSVPEQDDELRKVITSKLMAGAPILLLDNAREKRLFDYPSLASALTATNWTDRLLGVNQTVTLPNTQAWFLTGNNPRLSMELLRRSVRIRLDPRRDRAWQRDGFRHDPLLGWVRENRPALVKACLTLIQAWIAAGKPRGTARLGSFEEWASTMGGILAVSGIAGFLGNLEEVYENADNESEEWRAFVSVWWDAHRTRPQKVSELLELCERHELMAQVCGTGTAKSQQARLGKALAASRDRIFGTLQISVVHDTKTKTKSYRLRLVDPDPAPSGTNGSPADLFGKVQEAGFETQEWSSSKTVGNGTFAGKVAQNNPELAVGRKTYRQPTATVFSPVNPIESSICKMPAVGAVGFTPRVEMEEGVVECVHHVSIAAGGGSVGENLPHLPPASPIPNKINDVRGGRSVDDLPPTYRQPTASSLAAGNGQQSLSDGPKNGAGRTVDPGYRQGDGLHPAPDRPPGARGDMTYGAGAHKQVAPVRYPDEQPTGPGEDPGYRQGDAAHPVPDAAGDRPQVVNTAGSGNGRHPVPDRVSEAREGLASAAHAVPDAAGGKRPDVYTGRADNGRHPIPDLEDEQLEEFDDEQDELGYPGDPPPAPPEQPFFPWPSLDDLPGDGEDSGHPPPRDLLGAVTPIDETVADDFPFTRRPRPRGP